MRLSPLAEHLGEVTCRKVSAPRAMVTIRAEDGQDLRILLAVGAEPVRGARVELRDLAGFENHVAVTHDQADPATEHVHPR